MHCLKFVVYVVLFEKKNAIEMQTLYSRVRAGVCCEVGTPCQPLALLVGEKAWLSYG